MWEFEDIRKCSLAVRQVHTNLRKMNMYEYRQAPSFQISVVCVKFD